MCGINGLVGPDRALIRRMNAILHHRGPDQQGIYTDDYITIGNCRLAIQDLSEKGRMPMHNGNETTWITFNGEIYNFKDLREELRQKGHAFYSGGDTEVILRAYETWGKECVSHLNGEFAFCIYDSKKKTIFLARDRLGIKPLFYYCRTDAEGRCSFAFSSEIKAILLHPEVKREISPGALSAYLTLRYVPGEQTIIKGVRKLLPGHTLFLDLKHPKNMKIERYWQPSFDVQFCNENDAAKRLLSLLEDSVKRRMIADVPLGAFLSGGVDSTAMVALMTRHADQPVKTFSVGFDEKSFSEVRNSRSVAEQLKTDHRELTVTMDAAEVLPKVIWHLDDLMADPAAVPTYILSEATRRHVKVVLSGDGNDELLAGYWQYRLLSSGRRLGGLIPSVIRDALQKRAGSFAMPYARRGGSLLLTRSEGDRFLSVMATFTPEEKQELLSEEGKAILKWDEREFVRPYFVNDLAPLNQWLKFDQEHWLADDIMAKSDRMSLAHSLELRVPYLDHRYVEFANTLSPDLKLAGSDEKHIFKKAVKDIVPPSILRRKKHGFALPINEWLEKGLKDSAEEVFRNSPILNSPHFKRESIYRILKEHQSSRKVYKRQFWSLLTLALWHRIHIEEERTSPEGLRLGTL